ncbi:MAG: hypothetical protein NDJ89_08945 [Oligoflexia bacterium]|nr:hypothetical protein [Oligoflexia bacterium]
MIKTVLAKGADGVDAGRVEWVDVTAPTPEELTRIAAAYGLHPSSVQDCLDPAHLPKYERIGEIAFIIVRVHDDQAFSEADTVQELTRKIAVFIGSDFLLTIHRKDHPLVADLREKWGGVRSSRPEHLLDILADFFRNAVFSYEKPIERCQERLEDFETKIFRFENVHSFIEEGYYLKRKASVFKRTLRQTLEVFSRIPALPGPNSLSHGPLLQDLKESAERLHIAAEDVLENVNSLLNLHLALASHKTNEASHRTNEVMRVLTLFSVFFMPLNFIASIYGMNFEHMPELRHAYAYPGVLLGMLAVALGIFVWFRNRGWLK